jgi:hypothetical protein
MANHEQRMVRGKLYRIEKWYRYLAQINILRGLSVDEANDLRWFIAVHGDYQRPYWKVVHYKTPSISKNPIKRHSVSREQRAPFYRIPLVARKERIVPPSDRMMFVNARCMAKLRRKTHRPLHQSHLNMYERHTLVCLKRV